MDSYEENLHGDELSHESFDFIRLIWKIPDVLFLPTIEGYSVDSKRFSFAGGTWRLRMYPYGKDFVTNGSIDLTIVREDSEIPVQNIFSKFSFVTCNGKEFESFSGWDLFDSVYNEHGAYEYITRYRLQQKQRLIVPNNVLTILCELRTEKIEEINKCSQVKSTASILELSEKKSEKGQRSSSSACKGCDCTSQHHGNKALEDLKELFLKLELCDVTINVKGRKFQAHKAILIARSPVFASTFRNEMKEKATGVIDIEDCDPSSFSDFLCFLYSGSVENMSSENVFSLFTVADKYDVQDLRSECLEFIKKELSLDTFCDTISLALKYSEKELTEFSIEFFANHFKEIIVTVKWQSFVIKNPILSNEITIKALVHRKK